MGWRELATFRIPIRFLDLNLSPTLNFLSKDVYSIGVEVTEESGSSPLHRHWGVAYLNTVNFRLYR